MLFNMKQIIRSLSIVSILLLSVSCTNSGIMSFRDVRYVTDGEWPETLTFSECNVIPLPFETPKDFILLGDSLALFSTDDGEGFYKICRQEDFSLINSFIKRGRGPGEMPVPEFAGNFSMSQRNGHAIADFDGGNGKWISLDITSSLSEGVPVISSVDCPNNLALAALRLDERSYYFKELNRADKSQRRYILHDGKEETTKALDALNSVIPRVEDDGFSYNIISTITRFDPKHQMFVEASLFLNTIHIYSRDGSFSRTICLGNKLDNIKKIGSLMHSSRYASDIFIGDPSDPDVGFQVLCLGDGKAIPSSILCFAWDGSPVRKIVLSGNATYFQMRKGAIYTLDPAEEIFCKYQYA